MAVARRFMLVFAGVLAVVGCGDDKPKFPDASFPPNATFPGTVTLGAVGCGVATTQTFTVENTGGVALTYEIASSNPIVTVTPASGSIVGGTSTTFTASINPPAATAPNAALTATLTITTNVPGAQSVTVQVTATTGEARLAVRPPIVTETLAAEAPAVDFGFRLMGTTTTQDVLLRNPGTVIAIPQITGLSGVLEQIDAQPIAPGIDGVARIAYKPTSNPPQVVSQAATIRALGQCGGESIQVQVNAGNGPFAQFRNLDITGGCDRSIFTAAEVTNLGNQPLHVSGCVVSNPGHIDPILLFEPLTLEPGGETSFEVEMSDVNGISSTALIDCVVNEAAERTKTWTLHRDLAGADVVLTVLDREGLGFQCNQESEAVTVRVENRGEASGDVRILLRNFFFPGPLSVGDEEVEMAPGASRTVTLHHDGNGFGSGSPCNFAEDNPVYNGSLTAEIDFGKGDRRNVCTVTAIPVTLERFIGPSLRGFFGLPR